MMASRPKRRVICPAKLKDSIDNSRLSRTLKRIQNDNQTFSYNLDSLSWDESHKVNSEGVYCYCGQSGDWYRAMVQCVQCRQWFHERCLQPRPFAMPIMNGDTAYMFLCKICNFGEECLCRLYKILSWTDLVHLIVFNLTLKSKRQFHSLASEIMPYVEETWKAFQPRPEWLSLTPNLRRAKVWRALHQNPVRFCKNEKKWGLLKFLPPPQPKISLKSGSVVDEFGSHIPVERITTVQGAMSRIIVEPTKFLFNETEIEPPYQRSHCGESAKEFRIKISRPQVPITNGQSQSCRSSMSDRAVRKFAYVPDEPLSRLSSRIKENDTNGIKEHLEDSDDNEVYFDILETYIPRHKTYTMDNHPFIQEIPNHDQRRSTRSVRRSRRSLSKRKRLPRGLKRATDNLDLKNLCTGPMRKFVKIMGRKMSANGSFQYLIRDCDL